MLCPICGGHNAVKYKNEDGFWFWSCPACGARGSMASYRAKIREREMSNPFRDEEHNELLNEKLEQERQEELTGSEDWHDEQ